MRVRASGGPGVVSGGDKRHSGHTFSQLREGAQVQVESIAQFSSVLIPDLPAKPCSVILRDIGLWTFALSCDKIRPHLLNPVPFESFAVVVIKSVTIGTCDVLRNRSIMR